MATEFEPVALKDVEKKLEKMHIKDLDVTGGRDLIRPFAVAVAVIGFAMSLFHIWVLIVRPIDPWYFRTLHVVFGGVLLFALVPGWKNAGRRQPYWLDWIFIAMLVAPMIYIFTVFDDWIYRVGVVPTGWDFFFSAMFVVAVWEMARRATGWPLAILGAIFILYGHFGNYMPGLLYHKGYSWERMITYLFSLDGILSLPIQASAHYIFLFVLFGAFVDASGAGKFFVDFARCLAGRLRGGPAKVSIISSAMIGTASGSSVANVVVDGVFNIPLMKATGFRGTIAAAVEAMNSSGGQIVPPVMGAGAFLMAEILNMPYSQVCLAAVIPALLYFASAYWMIDLYSAGAGLRGLTRDEVPVFRKIMMEKGYLLIPLIILLVCLMVLMLSAYRSALYGIIALILASWISKQDRMGIKAVAVTLSKGARGSMEIIATCAAAGIIVGVLTQTGLGQKFAMIIFTYSQGSLLLALIFTMCIAIILGMGMPTTAAYAISASVLAPALIREFNVIPIAAHLFIFYYACLSALTPPVALASFAAAAIAGEKPWPVGFQSMRFALAGFIIPFMFIYGPAMVLVGSTWEIVSVIVTGLLGTLALAGAAQGWLLARLTLLQRAVMLAAAIALIKPGWITDIVGLGLLLAMTSMQWVAGKKMRLMASGA
ncbi:MAG: TRAP transporter permease [Desulfobacteraceae bacterium]|nr:MAG: TRAP transporter permease [Desulfobacteraceae bacterium]